MHLAKVFTSVLDTLPLHKFIEIVSFSKFFGKTSRRAEPIPTAGEKPLLINLRTKTEITVST